MKAKEYKKFMQHAKKVTNSEAAKTRPVLKGIKHFEDGSLACTDSHRLYLAKDMHDKGEIVLTPTGEKVEGNYPDIKRLLPDAVSEPIEMSVAEMIKGIDIVNVASKFDTENSNVMTWKDNKISGSVPELISATYELPYTIDVDLTSNAQYWLDALKLFKAFKYTQIKLNIYGKLRPFTLTSPDDKLMALILPVRSF